MRGVVIIVAVIHFPDGAAPTPPDLEVGSFPVVLLVLEQDPDILVH